VAFRIAAREHPTESSSLFATGIISLLGISISTPLLTVIANFAQAAVGNAYTGPHPVGENVPVKNRSGLAFVEIRTPKPS
jgi:hypothetical protein